MRGCLYVPNFNKGTLVRLFDWHDSNMGIILDCLWRVVRPRGRPDLEKLGVCRADLRSGARGIERRIQGDRAQKITSWNDTLPFISHDSAPTRAECLSPSPLAVGADRSPPASLCATIFFSLRSSEPSVLCSCELRDITSSSGAASRLRSSRAVAIRAML